MPDEAKPWDGYVRGSAVKLSPSEMLTAVQAGCMRQVQNSRNPDFVYTNGQTKENVWQHHCEGAMAEMAFAKQQGIYWGGKGVIGGEDVGRHDVRQTPYPTGHLLLHPEDPDDRPFWLLTGCMGVYAVQGWVYAYEGKEQRFWREDSAGPPKIRACYWVPQSELNKESLP